MDASKYIEELKKKVDKLNREIACTQNRIDDNTLPMVNLIPIIAFAWGTGLLTVEAGVHLCR